MNVHKIVMISLAILALFVGAIFITIFLIFPDSNCGPYSFPAKKQVLHFNDSEKKLFLLARRWGISGNHDEIILSEADKDYPDKNTDYVFYTTEIFYRIIGNRELIIYTSENQISKPSRQFDGIEIVINVSKSPEKNGINPKRFSIYEKANDLPEMRK